MSQFARWDVLHTLGGSMGDIHIVFDDEWERHLAIKTVQAAQGRSAWRRFQTEGRILVELAPHSRIVPVLFFEVWRGTPYLAMECVAGSDGIGSTLATLLSHRIFTPRELISMACMVAEGLVYIHSNGILHLDLHPGNCLIDTLGRVLLADFGIATIRGALASGLGMNCYAPPEQLDGRHVDETADVFSFGALLFTMACRQPPFDQDGTRKPYVPALDGYPDELEGIIEGCLRKEPTERPKSAATLLQTMVALHQRKTGKHHQTTDPRSMTFESQLNRAVSLSHLGKKELAIQKLKILLNGGVHEDTIWYNLGNIYASQEQWTNAAQCFEKSLKTQSNNVSALANLAYVVARQGDFESAEQIADRALAIDAHHAAALINKGFILGSTGKHTEALESFERLLHVQPHNPDGLASAAIALANLGRQSEAREYLKQLKTIEPIHPHIRAIEEEVMR